MGPIARANRIFSGNCTTFMQSDEIARNQIPDPVKACKIQGFLAKFGFQKEEALRELHFRSRRDLNWSAGKGKVFGAKKERKTKQADMEEQQPSPVGHRNRVALLLCQHKVYLEGKPQPAQS